MTRLTRRTVLLSGGVLAVSGATAASQHLSTESAGIGGGPEGTRVLHIPADEMRRATASGGPWDAVRFEIDGESRLRFDIESGDALPLREARL